MVTDALFQPLSGTIGSVVRGIDVRTLDAAGVAEIRAALVDRKVLFFPEQHLSPAELVTFGVAFGELTLAHPVMPVIGSAVTSDRTRVPRCRAA